MQKTMIAAILVAALAGCATTLDSREIKTYMVGGRYTATVGSPILRMERGRVDTVRRWVGVLNADGGWATEKRYSGDYVRGELLYGGISGRTIEISYREYRADYAAPAFFQNVKYDLAQSDTITFQNFRLQVVNASSSGIEVVLVSDAAR